MWRRCVARRFSAAAVPAATSSTSAVGATSSGSPLTAVTPDNFKRPYFGVVVPKVRTYNDEPKPMDLAQVEEIVRREFSRRSKGVPQKLAVQQFIRMLYEEGIISLDRMQIPEVVDIMMQYQYSNQYLNTKITYGVPEHTRLTLDTAIMWAQKIRYHDLKNIEAAEQEKMKEAARS